MLTALAAAALAPALSIIPAPVSALPSEGEFVITESTRISAVGDAIPEAEFLAKALRPATGYELPVGSEGEIKLELDSRHRDLGPEGYRMSVGDEGIRIMAAHRAGLFYGGQTLRQLLPSEIYSDRRYSRMRWVVPGVMIEDYPRFSWRGSMLDVARHYHPKEFVLKYIDLLAQHKMNVFHWHLTEDQGWRLEVEGYPELTKTSAWRKETIIGRPSGPAANWKFDGKPHGGYYTQDEVREIVAYAAERHITVVPEIEMPGHSQAVLAAYPHLGATGQPMEVRTYWGVSSNIYGVHEDVFDFLFDVLEQVLELFPSEFIHIGGDEVPKTQWEQSDYAQKVIKENGLKDEHELQSWFIKRVDKWLADRGRRLIGWDEILEGGLAPGATVMSWRGMNGGIAAAKAGHDVVMAPTSHTYFDYYQTGETENEPIAIGGNLPLERVYSLEPVPAELTEEEGRHILGAQGQLWGEYLYTTDKVEYMAYPRISALSEVVWSQKKDRDYDRFLERLNSHLDRLAQQDVNYRNPNK